MKDYGEIPGGKNELQPLLYTFHRAYPNKLWSKYRWFRNSRLPSLLPSLNKRKRWLTVVDRLGAPGDALITANVIRCIKENYPKLRINCITPNPELIRLDPHVDSINQPESFYSFDSSYWELIVRKEKHLNVVQYSLSRLNIPKYEYKAKYYMSAEESSFAGNEIAKINPTRPVIAICSKSKEDVKNWPENLWKELLEKLSISHTIIHLGDNSEPSFNNVSRFAGVASIRQSAALLSKAEFFIGPDSLLMHVANGLNIPSVIIFGGSRPLKCFGYEQNLNLDNKPNCSPCWIHKGYAACNESLKCLKEISVNQVLSSINSLMQN